MVSSHQAFSWNLTSTHLLYSLFSVCEILKPFPWKIGRGLIRASPSAKIVSWTVHCLLSSPDCAPQCQTVFAPVSSYPWPLLNVKGRGVWSTFAIVERLNLPDVPSAPSVVTTCWISWWKLRIFNSRSAGFCWAIFVARRYRCCFELRICQTIYLKSGTQHLDAVLPWAGELEF